MKFEEYYRIIGIEDQEDLNKLDNLLTIANTICSQDIEKVFISTSRNEKGKTDYGHLWFFSKGYTLRFEKWKLLTTPDMFMVPLNIQWLEIVYDNYDFFNPSEISTLQVGVKFKGNPFGEGDIRRIFCASGKNCNELKEIITDYLKPKISG